MMELVRKAYLSFILLFLYAPILILIAYSFNSGTYSTEWEGFTLDWYKSLAKSSDLIEITFNSFLLAFLAATGATIVGTAAAIALKRYQFLGKKAMQGLLFALLMSPDVVMGIALLVLFVALRMDLGFFTLLLSHITFGIPFVIVTVMGRITSLDENLTQAASDLGASEFQTLHKVILPLLWPAVLSGWLLAFTLSMDDVIISFFVSGPDFEILPLRIYSMVRLGVKPEINALCTILFILTMAIVFTSRKLVGDEE